MFHTLLVRQNEGGKYERVGIGMVQHGYLLRPHLNVRII